MKQKLNIKDPKTGKRRIGVRDIDTDKVSLSDGRKYTLKYLESIDTNGIGYFNTRCKGKIIQKLGKYFK